MFYQCAAFVEPVTSVKRSANISAPFGCKIILISAVMNMIDHTGPCSTYDNCCLARRSFLIQYIIYLAYKYKILRGAGVYPTFYARPVPTILTKHFSNVDEVKLADQRGVSCIK